MATHPFDQITEVEAGKAVALLRQANNNDTLHIKLMQIEEPPKKVMLKYLEAEHAGRPIAPPPRIVYSVYLNLRTKTAEEIWMNIDQGKITRRQEFPKNQHVPYDFEEVLSLEPLMLAHPEVQKALDICGITKEEQKYLTPDGWMYGADTTHQVPRRIQFLMYMTHPSKNDPDSNMYAMPLPFVPIWDIASREFVRIDWCATGDDNDDKNGKLKFTKNFEGSIVNNFAPGEYMSHLRDEALRDDLKPYNVIQPDGASFTMDGNLVKWQKWAFRVQFTPREGLVLSDVRFDGRQTFYRLSVSEMTVPYGDPRPPLNRKQAFDFGDCLGGMASNTLGLGCDCLGLIKYFDANLVHPNGSVERRKNVVCMHEQDDGILFKHVNMRTGQGRVARRRVLILQFILTVANYEYIFAWHFDQAAGIELEVRATGIVSTQYIDPGKTSKWGTVVGPSVLAASHQHVFGIRIDPAIDGQDNTIEVNEVALEPAGPSNPVGNGFYGKKELVEKSCALDAKQEVGRYLRIINENKINRVSMEPIGYKLMANPSPLLLAPEGSVTRERAKFGTHHFWVTSHRDNEFYAGGEWTNQSTKEIGGCADAVARNDRVRNTDVVLYHVFSLTHSKVRVEDYPLMPMERLSIGLVPHGFFEENPSLDVPSSNQNFNRSVEVRECRGCHRL